MTDALSPQRIREALDTSTFGHEVEHYPVALTTESLALGWLRQRGGSHGCLVVADREIAARSRRGAEWSVAASLAASTIVEPDLRAGKEDLLWAVALLTACAAYRDAGLDARPHWPELIESADQPIGLVKVESQLGPGQVASAVLTFRLEVPATLPSATDRLALLSSLVRQLEHRLGLEPQKIVDEYHRRCVLVGRRVQVDLLPRGTVRGAATSIDDAGGFGVEGTSGHIVRLGVDQIRWIGVA